MNAHDDSHEAYLRVALAFARVGLVVINREHRYVYANPAYADILGLAAADIVGRQVADVLVDVDVDRIRPRLERAFAGLRATYELQRRTAAGEFYYSVTYEPSKGPDGTVELIVVVITDITQQKTEDTVARRLAAIVESSDDAIIGKNLDGIITSWNAGAERVFGYSAEEMLGQSIFKLIPEGRDEEERGILARIREGRTVEHLETVRLSKSGRLLNIFVTSSPIKDASGTIVGASKVARDITEKRTAEAALRLAEERTRFALQSAGVGIWDMDYVTHLVVWSAEVEAHYGLAPGTFAGTFDAFLERIHPSDRQALVERVARAAETGSDFVTEHRAVWPDGSVHWLSGAGRVVLNERGEAFRAVGISQDVTSRRLLEDQYQQAQKMEAVGRLAGGVAHDFNNLLTAILGYCELLLDNVKAEDPLRGDIEEIQKAGASAARLTRQLLAFSRKQIIEPTLLDVNAVVAGLRGMIGRLLGEQMSIVVQLANDAMMVFADAGQVEQVVLNLSVNAKDAMPKGGVLTIETECVELDESYVATHFAVKPGTYIALTVSDTGTGITRDVMAHLFEPFFTTKEVGKGTGLGLATVHGIVARSGGSVGVYSEVGHGTSFVVYLPAADAVPIPMTASAAEPTRVRSSNEMVLVVEDSDGLRELARRLLRRHGFRVLTAASAEEASRVFDEHEEIDVLLTDVIMPGATGPELTEQLVRRRPGLKVVYMSGYTEDAIVQHGVLKPGIAFLHKPFNSDTLVRKIQGVLER